MPAPPKGQSAGAAGVIRSQCNEKIQAITRAVNEEISDFINTQSGAASLVQASWEYQESAIAARAKILPGPQRALFVRDHLREGCLLYLNTVAHEIFVTLADSAKPSFNRTAMDSKSIQKQFEISFFATYLAKSALKEPKATSTFGAKAPMAGDEDYYAYNYGTIKKLVWRNQLEAKLDDLGITRQYAGAHRILPGRTDEYKQAIQNWRPPMSTGPWLPVPYQEGGANAKGRLAAWAVEFTRRPPAELVRAILG